MEKERELYLTNVTVVDPEESMPVVNYGYVHIKNNYIHAFAEGEPPHTNGAEVRDCSGCCVMPGLVNTHGHSAMTLLRGYSDDLELKRWLREAIWPAEAKFDRDITSTGSKLAMAEMIRSGTTTFMDMYHLHINDVAEQVKQIGLRACLARGMIGMGAKEELAEKRTEAVELAKNWRGAAEGRLEAALFPHAPYTCPPSFLEDVAADAASEAIPLQIHLAESRQEVSDHYKDYGRPLISHMKELGILRPSTMIVHGVHVTEEDISTFRDAGVSLSHNPVSNLKLGSGIAPLAKYMKQGVPVSLGTDSAASNNTLDLFEEIRLTALLHKGVAEDASVVSGKEVLQMATANGAAMLGFSNTGKMKRGQLADLIVLEQQGLHLQPENNLLSHLVYSASGQDVRDVFVNGRCIMRNRELLTIDEERLRYDVKEQVNKF
ncbi:amidohydrolase [Salsuginibacillus kocurii]|uniref:amidohydrolase n=1 Tax=Salsuginibacillus kocurii TaxID=427078 RepID=UPI00036D8B79|nr:amidohydrolase [Salsuginibacillus kocurii]